MQVLVVALAAAIAGCGSSKPAVTPKPMLRGERVTTLTCPPHVTSSAATPTRILGVQRLLLCPLNEPGVSGRTVAISPRQPQFASLVAALSVPDEPSTTGACPAYADIPQIVLAQTMHGLYEVSIPVDACHHYQRPVLEALNRARAG